MGYNIPADHHQSLPIDYGKAEPTQSPETVIKRVGDLAQRVLALDKDIAQAQAHLDALTEKRRKLTEDHIPSVFEEAGVKNLTITDNGKEFFVEVDTDTRANIKKEDAPMAHAWLREHGFGGLIKVAVTTEFGKGEEEKAALLLKQLTKKYKGKVKCKEAVHPSTLRAFVVEVLEGKAKEMKKQGRKIVEVPVTLPPSINYVSLPVATIKEK